MLLFTTLEPLWRSFRFRFLSFPLTPPNSPTTTQHTRAGLCQNFAENFNTRYDVETDGPHFITKGHLYRAVVGDTIILPCKVKNLGSYILLWRRGAAVLTAASLMVTRDTRLKMVDGYNLQISDVKISDAGDYVCQIGDQEPRDQIHTLEILVPPSVKSVPDHGLVSARIGNTVTLECKSSGNPVPTVHWFRKVCKQAEWKMKKKRAAFNWRAFRACNLIFRCFWSVELGTLKC